MLALAHVIAEGTRYELAPGRHFLCCQSCGAEEAIDRVRGLEHLELAGRVGPLVSFGGGEQHRPRGAECYQAILVKRKPFRRVVELLKLSIEPVWELVVNSLYGLAGLPAARRGTTATGLVREGDGDALVKRRCEQRGFAVARVAQRRDAVRVHGRAQ